MGSLPVDMKGFIFSKPYTLVLTENKTAFAIVTSKLLKQHAKKAREQVKKEGGGKMDTVKKQMSAHFNHHHKYGDMTIDEILGENKKNFVIDNNTVTKVRIKKRTIDNQGFPETEVHIIMKTNSKKYKLILNEQMQLSEAKPILQQAYGSKVK
ncbi:hypothetical protein [Methanonatronarchaeum thermophilum]|uniref:hypothetical protein n=1 Tax=Methanonatronarchaeum thermophilum TaxID=1927129 RepID=UPI00117ACE41|nr:hypothetical protein [Methanonatronarchaeum thermophilum]